MLCVKIYLIACIMYWQFMENLSKLLSKLKTLTVGQKCVHRDSSCSSPSLHFGCDSNGIQNCNASEFQTPQCKCKWKTSNLILYSGIKKKAYFLLLKFTVYFSFQLFSQRFIFPQIFLKSPHLFHITWNFCGLNTEIFHRINLILWYRNETVKNIDTF